MALPTTGPLSMSQVNVELGLSSTATISLNQANVRTLAGVPSGAISMQNLRGKANQFAFTIASNVTNANLRTLAVNAGWPGTSKVVATINSGVIVSANSTGTPGLTINGSFPGGVELINNGTIAGMGGAGGNGQILPTSSPKFPGAAGGLALAVSVAVSLRNNGTIGGGGGGGGGGGSVFSQYFSATGGGGGGGRTGATNSAGGAAGGGGSSAGEVGTSSSGGTGGFGGGGNGGGGTGGDYGASGSAGGNGGAGGGAGGAITGNGNITYLATGTRLGAIT